MRLWLLPPRPHPSTWWYLRASARRLWLHRWVEDKCKDTKPEGGSFIYEFFYFLFFLCFDWLIYSFIPLIYILTVGDLSENDAALLLMYSCNQWKLLSLFPFEKKKSILAPSELTCNGKMSLLPFTQCPQWLGVGLLNSGLSAQQPWCLSSGSLRASWPARLLWMKRGRGCGALRQSSSRTNRFKYIFIHSDPLHYTTISGTYGLAPGWAS